MMQSRSLRLASVIALAVGCGDSRNEGSTKKITRDLPEEVMAVIPAGMYLATKPLLPPGRTCDADMQRELNQFGGETKDTEQYVAAFAIDKQRVSCRDFLDCIRQNGCEAGKYRTYETVVRNPVSVCWGDDAVVDLDQAKGYCAWRGRQLPTFLQWQVAARGSDGARIVDANCVQRGERRICQAISSFGVLVSSALPGEELTRTMDCFPELLIGDWEKGRDEWGRVPTLAVTDAQTIAGKPKLLLYRSMPGRVGAFRCASEQLGSTRHERLR